MGKMVLNRNPVNYFAEVEQAAFAPSNMVPGIEPSPDKMLQVQNKMTCTQKFNSTVCTYYVLGVISSILYRYLVNCYSHSRDVSSPTMTHIVTDLVPTSVTFQLMLLSVQPGITREMDLSALEITKMVLPITSPTALWVQLMMRSVLSLNSKL